MSDRRRTPLLLHIELGFELEHADYVLKPLARSIGRDFWKCAHGKRSVAFVILTEESSRELVSRLALADIGAIEDYSCYIAPIGAVCKHGGFSTLHVALDKAWKAVGERRHPSYRGLRQRFDPRNEKRVDNRDHGAVRERVRPNGPVSN
jgi:hypothetical protein